MLMKKKEKKRPDLKIDREKIDQMVADTPAGGRRCSMKLLAGVATLGGLLFGYDTGVVSGAIPLMEHPVSEGGMGLTPMDVGWITATLLMGAAFGALIGGKISDRQGRRRNILILAVIFFVGAVGTAIAPNMAVMLICRFILGLAVGGASTTVPIYLGESAPKELRGTIVAVDAFMVVTGQLLAFIINAVIVNSFPGHGGVWRWMLFVCSLPAVFLWFGMRLMSESPRWHAARGQYFEAIAVLKRTRPDDYDLGHELNEMVQLNEAETSKNRGGWSDLKQRWVRHVVIVGVGVAILQQTTGVNILMYYAPTILIASGMGETASISAQVANGVISVAGAGLALYLIGRFARRKLILTAQFGIVCSLALIAGIFWIKVQPHLILANGANVPDPSNPPPASAAYIVILGMLTFLFFQQAMLSPTTWVVLSEIFPAKMRGFGIGMAVFGMWIVNAIITFVFPLMVAHLGGGMTFAIFAAINVGTLIFSIFMVPETKHLTLEELEIKMRTRYDKKAKVRILSDDVASSVKEHPAA